MILMSNYIDIFFSKSTGGAEGGSSADNNQTIVEPQSSESRLLAQCMVVPSYSSDSTDWSSVTDSGSMITNSRKLWSLTSAVPASATGYAPMPVPSNDTFSAGDSETQFTAFCQ